MSFQFSKVFTFLTFHGHKIQFFYGYILAGLAVFGSAKILDRSFNKLDIQQALIVIFKGHCFYQRVKQSFDSSQISSLRKKIDSKFPFGNETTFRLRKIQVSKT